ncbi:hypothetical protein DFH09DRAFT_143537 [Mycena vulgaris]|nr:hypothetical protein DFH09DRAFT_143537 [Mycena vulgaris]
MLENGADVGCSLDRLAGPRQLKISASYYNLPAQLSPEVLHIVAQSRGLSTLHLSGARCDDGWCAIWSLLRTKEIHLKDISETTATSALLVYLGYYAGLERLALRGPSGSEIEAAQLSDMFFAPVLLRHAHSLVELSCPAAFESSWSFGSRAAGAIA